MAVGLGPGVQRAQDTNTGHKQRCAVLARIDQMSLVFGVMKTPVINMCISN